MKAWARSCWRASGRASRRSHSSPNRRLWAAVEGGAMKTKRLRAGADPEVMMDINTTPLIDVMLVLLVMLIITIPIQLHAVNLEMPVGTPPVNNVPPEKIQIDIDE